MKILLIKTINFYQAFLYHFLKNVLGINPVCRFETSCSVYAKNAIEKNGAFKGSQLAFSRLLKCQPFYNAK